MYGWRTNNWLAAIVVATLLGGAGLGVRATAAWSQLATPTALQVRLSGTWQLKFADAKTRTWTVKRCS